MWREVIRSLRKGARQRVRYRLRIGQYDGLPETFYVGYTDFSKARYLYF